MIGFSPLHAGCSTQACTGTLGSRATHIITTAKGGFDFTVVIWTL